MSSLGSRRRGSGRSRGDLPVNAEINVTSLVDVAFTLLVIFIITAPILQGGIEVAIPKADVRPLTSADNPLFVTVEGDGTVLIEESPIPIEEVESALSQIAAAGEIERVYLRADSVANWAAVMRVMAAAQNAGVPWSAVAVPYREGG